MPVPTLHLNEDDPRKVAQGRAVFDEVLRCVEVISEVLATEIKAHKMLVMFLYHEHATVDALNAAIKKYEVDAEPELIVETSLPEIGIIFGLVMSPRLGRGTIAQIMERQTGAKVPPLMTMEAANARPV